MYVDAFRDAADAAGLEIIEEQTIDDGDEAPPQAQVAAIADAAPDVIMATPLGAQCPTFMTEMANQLAVRTDWHPAVYITNTCASPLILAVAGDHANGLYTSASMGLADVANPDVQTGNPAVAAYIAEMNNQGFGDIITTAAAGWNVGEVTLAILQNAAASEAGLTQASIIDAARNLTSGPTLLRDNLARVRDERPRRPVLLRGRAGGAVRRVGRPLQRHRRPVQLRDQRRLTVASAPVGTSCDRAVHARCAPARPERHQSVTAISSWRRARSV